MNIQIFGKSKCFDTKKAQRYFKERGIKFQFIDILQKAPSKGEFQSILSAVGELSELIDEKEKDFPRIAYLAYEQDKVDKLLETPRLFKTPIVRDGKKATIGFKPEIWKSWE